MNINEESEVGDSPKQKDLQVDGCHLLLRKDVNKKN